MIDDCVPSPLSECATAAKQPESVDQLRNVIDGLEKELIACQRLALMGSLVAMVTHEFNNLLTPIMARSEAALMSPDDVAFMRKTLERALTQSKRAMEVTRHLLDLAQDQPTASAVCSVAEAVHEAIETMTRPLDKDQISLQVSVPEELQVRAREDLLCQVLLNLLLNARRAMSSGGGMLTVHAQAENEFVRIEVRDSGTGIPRERLNDVINPFLAADPFARPNDWQQVGLGLSVCRMIAHRHGASIQASDNDGPGCTFRVWWPVSSNGSADAS